MAPDKFDLSRQSGVHFRLSGLEGTWEGITKTWFEPDKLADESPMKGEMKLVLGGRFILHEYKGIMQGEPFEGISIYGYNLNEDRFQAINIDSFHSGTAIMTQNGEEGIDKFSALGYYIFKVSPTDIQKWGWRTEIDIIDKDNIIITTYNITPAGDEAKGVETKYKRIK